MHRYSFESKVFLLLFLMEGTFLGENAAWRVVVSRLQRCALVKFPGMKSRSKSERKLAEAMVEDTTPLGIARANVSVD